MLALTVPVGNDHLRKKRKIATASKLLRELKILHSFKGSFIAVLLKDSSSLKFSLYLLNLSILSTSTFIMSKESPHSNYLAFNLTHKKII